jgi:hypothetical protein
MSTPPSRDNRTGKDRRNEDVGPPFGLEERRLTPERRLPAVEHVEFDAHIEVLPPVAAPSAAGCQALSSWSLPD